MAVGTFAHDVAISLEGTSCLVIELLRSLLNEFAVIVELAEKIAGELVVCLARGTRIDVERDAELLEGVLDHLVVAIHYLLWSDALFAGTLGDGHAMLVAATNKHHILAL